MSVIPSAAPGSALVLTAPTIRTIQSLQAELAEHLDNSGTVQIDGTSVDRVDTAGLQLLAAFVRDLQAEMRAVEWIGCSDALRKAAQSLGLGEALGVSGAAAGGSLGTGGALGTSNGVLGTNGDSLGAGSGTN